MVKLVFLSLLLGVVGGGEGRAVDYDTQLVSDNPGPGLSSAVHSESLVQARILDMAYEALREQYNEKDYRFELSARWIPGRLHRLNTGDIVSVSLKGDVGRFTTFVVRTRDSRRNESIDVQLAVDIFRRLPVASERVMYGEVIREEQIEYSWVPVHHNHNRLVDDSDFLVGKTIRRTLAPGQPVREADIASAFVVQAGEEVTLIFDNNGITISIQALARQDGEMGEVITLYSNETRTRYLGRVIDPGVTKWKRTL
ncbi:MAG: flagellar basal body P-ring formation chaperone FlgA [Balneolia bacterium]|nr:flagellar basal body P-ring formation chaperone FlgA [Balneolia bacterium]